MARHCTLQSPGSASFAANNFLLPGVFFCAPASHLIFYLSSFLLLLQTFLISCLAAVARLASATTNTAAAKLKMKFVARIDFQNIHGKRLKGSDREGDARGVVQSTLAMTEIRKWSNLLVYLIQSSEHGQLSTNRELGTGNGERETWKGDQRLQKEGQWPDGGLIKWLPAPATTLRGRIIGKA